MVRQDKKSPRRYIRKQTLSRSNDRSIDMNTLIQDNRCHECKKLFCCASCRDLHEKKKHPRPKTDEDCLLCSSKKLPLERLKNSKFLCHLVIRHLPLICVLCGHLYRNSSDLENFSKCEYWRRKSRHSLLQDSLKRFPAQVTPSPIVRTISCPAASSSQKDSPDSEFHTLQSFTSPPELMRNTSTPMHIGVTGQRRQSQFKTPKPPSFFLKTPRTPTAVSAQNKSTAINLTSSSETIEIDPSPSLFYSATSQLLISKEVNSDSTPFSSLVSGSRSFISGDTPSRSSAATPSRGLSEEGCGYSREFFRTNSGRILEVMEEQEEQVSINMDLTEAQDHLSPVSTSDMPDPSSTSVAEPARDASKKVRFSDQHQFVAAESTVDPVSDSEEFYEATESPAEKSIAEKRADAQMMRENEDNSDKENLGSPENSKMIKPQAPSSGAPEAATSSRVVMMVVVENGFEISTTSLVPLISSSLQKLERNPLTSSICASSLSNISNQLQTTPNGLVRSVSAVDSYTTSSTIDYYSTKSSPNSTAPHNQPGSSSTSSGNGGGGILSAMAQAMRYAFRGIPGAGPSKGSPAGGLHSFDSNSSGSSAGSSRASASSFSTIATSLLHRRPGKRSRDPISDAVLANRREPRSPRNELVSPVAKRPRSWHKIRGRDPIARMRRDTPPANTTRGVSSETQHFQQGSLSVGDTVLPLPSRAHQSTQTD